MKEFKIFTSTKFGIGLIRKKARSFSDAFKRLPISDRMKAISIMDEDGEEFSVNEIINLIELDIIVRLHPTSVCL